MDWPVEQGEFILVSFLIEKSLICSYITKPLTKTSDLRLVKVVQGRLGAKVGHLEAKKVSFVCIS
jgi:hypothetical protein